MGLLDCMIVLYFVYPHLKSSQRDMYVDNESDLKQSISEHYQMDDEFIKATMYNDTLVYICLLEKNYILLLLYFFLFHFYYLYYILFNFILYK